MEGFDSSPLKRSVPVLIIIVGLIGLYYLYHYLYGPKKNNVYTLLEKNTVANSNPSKPIIITSDKLPHLYEGGEFSISTWVYVNNWSYRAGFSKSILNLGGPNFDTIRIYLGGYKPRLNVRLHTRDSPNEVNSDNSESLVRSSEITVFDTLQPEAGLIDSMQLCDLPEIELQRWINISVSVNGKSVDVYLNGKLARSCVLPKPFKVDAGGYSANILPYGGFGGQISSTMMYDSALNPEEVYKNYMAGPEPYMSNNRWILYLALIVFVVLTITGAGGDNMGKYIMYGAVIGLLIYIFYQDFEDKSKSKDKK